jgi:hypothetical protein
MGYARGASLSDADVLRARYEVELNGERVRVTAHLRVPR